MVCSTSGLSGWPSTQCTMGNVRPRSWALRSTAAAHCGSAPNSSTEAGEAWFCRKCRDRKSWICVSSWANCVRFSRARKCQVTLLPPSHDALLWWSRSCRRPRASSQPRHSTAVPSRQPDRCRTVSSRSDRPDSGTPVTICRWNRFWRRTVIEMRISIRSVSPVRVWKLNLLLKSNAPQTHTKPPRNSFLFQTIRGEHQRTDSGLHVQLVLEKKNLISQTFIHDTQNIQQNIHSFKTASCGLKQTNWGGHLCCSFLAPPFDSSVVTSHVSTKAKCYFSVCVCLCCLHHITGCSHCKTFLQVCSGMIISPLSQALTSKLLMSQLRCGCRWSVYHLQPLMLETIRQLKADQRDAALSVAMVMQDTSSVRHRDNALTGGALRIWSVRPARTETLDWPSCWHLALLQFTSKYAAARGHLKSPDVTWSQDNVWFWTDKVSGYTVMSFPVFTLSSFKGPRRVHFKNV